MLTGHYPLATHCQILGRIGEGKTTFCRYCCMRHLDRGFGFCVLDRKDLVDHLIADLCAAGCTKPVWLLDFTGKSGVLPWNPLRACAGESVHGCVERIAEAVVSASRENISEMWNYHSCVSAVLTLAMETKEPLHHAALITQQEQAGIRQWAVNALQDEGAKHTIRKMQAAAARSREWEYLVGSTERRLAKLVSNPAIRQCIGVPDKSIDIAAIRQRGEILLVKLAPDSAPEIAALLTSEILQDSLQPAERPWFAYLDEPQEYVSPQMASMLNLSRHSGLRVSLCYHHPAEGRFAENKALNDSIETNCGIKVVFAGLPLEYAKEFGETFFLKWVNGNQVRATRTRRYVDYDIEETEYGRHALPSVFLDDDEEIFYPRDEKIGQAALQIINVPNRCCWIQAKRDCFRFRLPYMDDARDIVGSTELAKFHNFITVNNIPPDDANAILTTKYADFLTKAGGRSGNFGKKANTKPIRLTDA